MALYPQVVNPFPLENCNICVSSILEDFDRKNPKLRKIQFYWDFVGYNRVRIAGLMGLQSRGSTDVCPGDLAIFSGT